MDYVLDFITKGSYACSLNKITFKIFGYYINVTVNYWKIM